MVNFPKGAPRKTTNSKLKNRKKDVSLRRTPRRRGLFCIGNLSRRAEDGAFVAMSVDEARSFLQQYASSAFAYRLAPLPQGYDVSARNTLHDIDGLLSAKNTHPRATK